MEDLDSTGEVAYIADSDHFEIYNCDEAVWVEFYYNIEPSSHFTLCALCPNSFNPSTVISFELRDAGFVELAVYDVNGREVVLLEDGYLDAGRYEVTFNASDLPSGVYFARMTAGEFTGVIKTILLK
ncbi:MAG: T9SS type A sorting domain-containing protein [candidate division Zixibacteria bacterium]|nr:T9SS type A sorting domain-containing protein [Candidatus Tariuqbacter arcticus]